MAKRFLKNHDFIHVNSSVAGKYNKHKQDGSHLRFPIRMILATVDLQVTSILLMNFESIALLVQEKKFKTDFQDGRLSLNLGFPIATISAVLLSTSHPDASYQVSSQLASQFRRRREK